MINWINNYGDFLTNIIIALVTISGIIIAGLGLSTWKKQLSGKVEYELAHRLMRATYAYRDALRAVRNPFISLPAPTESAPFGSEAYGEWKKQATTKVYEDRWDKVNKAKAAIETELIEAEVIWESNIKSSFDQLFKLDADLYYHVLTLLDSTDSETRERMSPEEKKAHHAILYSRSDKTKDLFYQSLQAAVTEVEKVVKPYLRRYR